jgi:ElaB/YqjD/DUF883 family membrane-anchored ribosome-binding protein
MGERTDEVRRGPLSGIDREPDPLVETVDGPERVEATLGPALGGGGAVVDEGEATRAEIEHTRADIERTRADMSETVDAIQDRLSPESLKEQAKDRVKEATVGKAQEAGSGIIGTIRANPLPAALTGIGLGWLLVNTRRQSSAQGSYRAGAYAHDYPPRYDARGADGPSAGQAVERVRDRAGETATQVQDKAGQVAGQAQDRAGRLGNQARYQAQRASGGFQRMLQENPLAVGALGVGVGAAVGLAIPETTKEHEVMGEARDTFVEKAQEKAQDAQERVQQVAQEAQSAAQQEAENQGLTQ